MGEKEQPPGQQPHHKPNTHSSNDNDQKLQHCPSRQVGTKGLQRVNVIQKSSGRRTTTTTYLVAVLSPQLDKEAEECEARRVIDGAFSGDEHLDPLVDVDVLRENKSLSAHKRYHKGGEGDDLEYGQHWNGT